MNTTCSVYIATSLDGFIAKPDGDIDWLLNPSFTLEGEDFGYSEFMNSVDALIMGRNTFEKVLTFGDWPYQKPVIVLSSKLLTFPDELRGKVHHMSGSSYEVLRQAKELNFKNFYIDGGRTIQQFLNAGLIQQLIITKIPVILGSGIPLFGELDKDIELELLNSIEFDNDFVQLTYKPKYT